jgi:RHS repeat-associated protein/uncharacterized repeat protein (TIGR01451 family)
MWDMIRQKMKGKLLRIDGVKCVNIILLLVMLSTNVTGIAQARTPTIGQAGKQNSGDLRITNQEAEPTEETPTPTITDTETATAPPSISETATPMAPIEAEEPGVEATEPPTEESTPTASETPTPEPSSTPSATEILSETPTPSSTPTTIGGTPELSFKFSVTPEQAAVDDVVTFTLEIGNSGETPVSGLQFSNSLPSYFNLVTDGHKGFNFDEKTRRLTWDGTNLEAPGEKITLVPSQVMALTYTVQVGEVLDEEQIVDTATLSADGLEKPLMAEATVTVLQANQKMTLLNDIGGEAVGVDGRVKVKLPKGVVQSGEAVIIEDLTPQQEFQTTSEKEPWLKFSLDLSVPQPGKAEVLTAPSSDESSALSNPLPVEGGTASPTPTQEVQSEEPAETTTVAAEVSLTATLKPIATMLPEETATLAPEEAVEESPTTTREPIATMLPEETATLAPKEAVEESPTTTREPTATVLPEETTTPIPVEEQPVEEQDRLIPLEAVEAQFKQPVEITVSFEGLADLATLGAEYTPILVTLDESSGTWVRVPLKSINQEANTITAEIAHFSNWGAGLGYAFPVGNVLLFDSANPALFTGRSRFSLPIWTPPGRNGMGPALSLSYSSGTVDGILADIQAPWVGMGWNIDTVEIARKITSTSPFCESCVNFYGYENKFLLLFNGTGYELIPDGTIAGRYHTKAESYLYIQLHNDNLGNNSPEAANASGEWWEVVERNGTRWRLGWNADSEQLAAMKGYPGTNWTSGYPGWGPLGYAGHATDVVGARWRADRVTDTQGNRMSLTYAEEYRLVAGTSTNYDRANYLENISYTEHTSGIPAAGYSVTFVRETRGGADVPIAPKDWDAWETERLDRIEVKYGETVVRTYDLGYEVRPYSEPEGNWDTTVLSSVAASGGETSAPVTTFSYVDNNNRATINGQQEWPYPRLESIQNGWGGIATYTYGYDARGTNSWYNWRVLKLAVNDGVNAYPASTDFAYATPCYRVINPTTWSCNGTNLGELVGYAQTTATMKDFNGTTTLAITVHKFYTNDEQKSGREYQTQYKNAAGTILRQTDITFTEVIAGLPAGGFFTYASQVNEKLLGGSLAIVNHKEFTYDNTTGNLTREYESDGLPDPALHRQVDYSYQTNTSPSVWILDKLWKRVLSGGPGNAEQQYGYDGNLPGSGTLSEGKLTLSRQAWEGRQTVDVKYVYDNPYGNVNETDVYQIYGSTNSLPSGTPGSDYFVYTATYDEALQTYVTSTTNPLGHATQTNYNFGLGLPITVTDANGNMTTSDYDGLGRVTKVAYPGFDLNEPNIKYMYPTASISAPYAIKMEMWDYAISDYRAAWQIMDGLGRVIQTQGPYETAGVLVLSDTSYNAMGLTDEQGLPRTLSGAGESYYTPNWANIPHTTISYDALGRTISVENPDESEETYSYSGLSTTTIDPNGHKRVQQADAFGRLANVQEYTGSGTYTLYASTAYGYDVRDLLTDVLDAASNATTIQYDGFGRKTYMTDPDMQTWAYQYYANGNLHFQTDARGCTATVTYDALNRPVGKTYSGPGACASTPSVTYTYDSTDGGNEGIGRRTGMSNGPGTGTTWTYDMLGQPTNVTQTIDGTNYASSGSFDAFGRPINQTLPSQETLTYAYNAMGALLSVSGSDTYVSQMHYTADGQVTDQILGTSNNLIQQYCYDPQTERLLEARTYAGSKKPCVATYMPEALFNVSYSHDFAGNLSNVDSVRQETVSYTYDDLDRLVGASGPYTQSYAYDQVGNLTSRSSTPSISVVSTGGHTCALTSAGGMLCWGPNDYGQIGDGTTTDRFTPVNVSGLTSNVAVISAGGLHTCAVTGGAAKCWGYNLYGQIGNGTTTNKTTPVNVTGLSSGVTSISAGLLHTCAVTSAGAAKCWGYGGDGQLGDGYTTDRHTPVNVYGLSNGVIAISAGNNHSCALLSGGTLKCWGNNSHGELGDGTFTSSNTPVAVSGLTNVIAIDAGSAHTCALTSSGELKCWGYNFYGQLGDGTSTDRSSPVTPIGFSSDTVAFSAGGGHTCAKTSTGNVKCWGDNESGQLGDGTRIYQSLPGGMGSEPRDVINLFVQASAVYAGDRHTCILTTSGEVKCWGYSATGALGNGPAPTQQNVPVTPHGLVSSISAVVPGSDSTCALTTYGGVLCWGSNEFGQLGNGTLMEHPTPIEVSGLSSGVAAIVNSDSFSCALTTGGGVKCWGKNGGGYLGDGTTTNRSTPVDVIGLGSGVTAIATNGWSTCALTAGGVKCWGSNVSGEVGDGTTSYRSTPVDVVGLDSGVSAITTGAQPYFCALMTSGGVKCWGTNGSGQLGDGTTTQRNSPVEVSELSSGVSAVKAGYGHTCAVLTSGGVKCWGSNGTGQLGDGTTTYRLTPVAVLKNSNSLPLDNALDVVLSFNHTCALRSTNGVMCWGNNAVGQLGDGTTTQRTKAVNVSNLTSGVAAIKASFESNTCALTTGGGIKCWGENEWGHLGDGTTTSRTTPVDAIGLTAGVAALSDMSFYSACAVMSNGGARCWGGSIDGQVGDGTSAYRTSPVDVIFPTSASVDYDNRPDNHQVRSLSTGETYNYDANGNMTYRIEGGQTFTQTFDAENRLISVTVNSQTTQFVYDGDGNLVKKIKPDGTCTIYVGGVYEVEKVACGGATTHTRVYYPAGGAMRVDGTLYFVIKDHLGSASVVTNASGNLVDEQRYFPYGESRLAGDNMLTDRLFTGQREMAELGIYHYGARFYDPLLMRFIQPDTLIPNPADPQMLNRYSYAGNSPLNYSDPSGYTRIDVINRLKRAYGKHLWQEGGASKYWNRTGKRWDFKPGDDSDTTDTITPDLIYTGRGITLSYLISLGLVTTGTTTTTTTTVPNASVTLASLTGEGGGDSPGTVPDLGIRSPEIVFEDIDLGAVIVSGIYQISISTNTVSIGTFYNNGLQLGPLDVQVNRISYSPEFLEWPGMSFGFIEPSFSIDTNSRLNLGKYKIEQKLSMNQVWRKEVPGALLVLSGSYELVLYLLTQSAKDVIIPAIPVPE